MEEKKKPKRTKTSYKARLTKPQEVFIQELIKGQTQRKAYLKAYPNTRKWKETSVDCAASLLFGQTTVKQRYEEALQEMRRKEQETGQWTREESIKTLRFVIDKNKDDIDRIYQTAEEELELLAKMMQEQPEKAGDFLQYMIKQKKTRRISGVHNQGIVSAVTELNKMQGFNEENINLNGTVIFEGEEELPE